MTSKPSSRSMLKVLVELMERKYTLQREIEVLEALSAAAESQQGNNGEVSSALGVRRAAVFFDLVGVSDSLSSHHVDHVHPRSVGCPRGVDDTNSCWDTHAARANSWSTLHAARINSGDM